MIMKTILLAALMLILGYAIAQRKRAPMICWVVLASSCFGIVFVVKPDLSTQVAQILGIGRGADLVFYIFILVALTAIFNIHLRLRANHEVITELARSIALDAARGPAKDVQ